MDYSCKICGEKYPLRHIDDKTTIVEHIVEHLTRPMSMTFNTSNQGRIVAGRTDFSMFECWCGYVANDKIILAQHLFKGNLPGRIKNAIMQENLKTEDIDQIFDHMHASLLGVTIEKP